MIKKQELTTLEIIENLQAVYKRAMEAGDFTNANKAMEHLGKYMGMFVERKATLNLNANMSPQELDFEISKLTSKLYPALPAPETASDDQEVVDVSVD